MAERLNDWLVGCIAKAIIAGGTVKFSPYLAKITADALVRHYLTALTPSDLDKYTPEEVRAGYMDEINGWMTRLAATEKERDELKAINEAVTKERDELKRLVDFHLKDPLPEPGNGISIAEFTRMANERIAIARGVTQAAKDLLNENDAALRAEIKVVIEKLEELQRATKAERESNV